MSPPEGAAGEDPEGPRGVSLERKTPGLDYRPRKGDTARPNKNRTQGQRRTHRRDCPTLDAVERAGEGVAGPGEQAPGGAEVQQGNGEHPQRKERDHRQARVIAGNG